MISVPAPFKKIINFNLVFGIIVAVFVITLAIVARNRGGRDLKVGLFGVEQVLQKKSPYENPLDPKRPIFRYAPGFAILQYPFLLKSKMVAPFEFQNIAPSIFAWYLAVILSLAASAVILLKIIPSAAKDISIRNLKVSFLLAMPLIGYELSNCQNKLIALFFMLLALFLFERKRLFWAALSFCLALTVYVALLPFLFYFVIREKKFILSFIVAVLIVFFVLPSLILGVKFNIFLLKEWFVRTLKPFFFTNSYAAYIDLRNSSQSLPSAIGRIFVSGKTGSFKYLISPLFVHIIIRVFSAIIVLLSCLAVWRSAKTAAKGLGYAIFLMLALILPQYCIFYTWAWIFVFYFAALNYISYPEVSGGRKRLLLASVFISYVPFCLMGVRLFNHLSLIFWATLILWAGMVSILIQ
jgi:hypothetical protein